MAATKDIAWIAGLFEGEGSFGNRNGSSPGMYLQMTDRDVVERAAKILGVDVQRPYKPRGKATYKQVYGLAVCGSHAIGWMQTIWILMGRRRRERIRQIVKEWAAKPGPARARRGEITMATCHPDRRVRAKGLCVRCYQNQFMRGWRAKRRETKAPG